LQRALLAIVFALLGWAVAGPAAFAHEVRPAYLQIREVEPDVYDLLWKTPAQGNMRLALNVVLPQACADFGDERVAPFDGAYVQTWRTRCDGGLTGGAVRIENLEATLTDTILRFEPLSGDVATLRLTPNQPSAAIPGRQSWSSVAWTYVRLGVEHILLGFDHLLFVLCLLILVGDIRRLLGAVTAFTVAHSLTLAGTTLGWMHLPIAPVEACIALSIALVAAEIVREKSGQAGVTARWPWIASFCFGLLHGFGFASALSEIGLPAGAVPLALLFFNLGVEAGQLVFIAAVLLLVRLVTLSGRQLPASAWKVPTYAAGTLAAFWFIERTAAILSV